MAISLEDGEAQRQTPSLDKRLCCGNAATTFCKPPLPVEVVCLLQVIWSGRCCAISFWICARCSFRPFFRKNVLTYNILWWVGCCSTEYRSIPFLWVILKHFFGLKSQSRCIPCKVMLWLSTFAYNRPSDHLFKTYVLSFPSPVVFSDSRYSPSRYKKLLNSGANFRTILYCRIICNLF